MTLIFAVKFYLKLLVCFEQGDFVRACEETLAKRGLLDMIQNPVSIYLDSNRYLVVVIIILIKIKIIIK